MSLLLCSLLTSCREQGLHFTAVFGLHTVAASLVEVSMVYSCSSWAFLLCGVWNLPGPGIKPVSPTLADGFCTTEPPGKPKFLILDCEQSCLRIGQPWWLQPMTRWGQWGVADHYWVPMRNKCGSQKVSCTSLLNSHNNLVMQGLLFIPPIDQETEAQQA